MSVTDIEILSDPPRDAYYQAGRKVKLVWADGRWVTIRLEPGQEIHNLLTACNVNVYRES